VLDRALADAKLNGAVFIYDVVDGKMAPALARAIAENPEIFDRLTNTFGSRTDWLDSSHMPASMQKWGWPLEPRWWVVDRRGQIAFTSTEPPTEEVLLKQLRDADIQELSQILKQFVRKNPGREDALVRLLNRQCDIAIRKMQKYLAPAVDRPNRPGQRQTPELKRPMTAREDEEIWADFADTLKLVVKSDAWTHTNSGPTVTMYSDANIFLQSGTLMSLSPLMRDLSAQLLPSMTDVIKEFPESLLVWTLWLILERASGGSGSAILPLISSIEPRPFAPGEQPPGRVLDRLIENADHFSEVEKHHSKLFEAKIKSRTDAAGKFWEPTRKADAFYPASQLIYIYLRRGDDYKAEQILMKFVEWSGDDCKPQLDWAIGLATNLANANQPGAASVAARWRDIDIERYKNAKNNVSSDSADISWIVIEEDDSHDISDAFIKEITSYSLDSFPAQVKVEKQKNVPQFAHFKPGWGLYDGKNRMFDYTEEPPSDDSIRAMAKRNGVVSKIEEYEKFRKMYPRNAHIEADLLTEYLQLANKRMARFNLAQPEKPMLPEEDDRIIWGSIARILEEFLENGRYRYVLLLQHIRYLDLASQSPMMKRTANRLIYPVEEMIKRDPAYIVNYPLWFSLNELAGGKKSLMDTLSNLTPVPSDELLFNPRANARIIGQINKEALKYKEWDFIIGTATPYWNYWLYWWENKYPNTDDDVLAILSPLVEALLATDQDAEAEKLFAEFMEKIPSGEVQTQLAQIANKRGKAELGKKWLAARVLPKGETRHKRSLDPDSLIAAMRREYRARPIFSCGVSNP
jgi:hypothetical protein